MQVCMLLLQITVGEVKACVVKACVLIVRIALCKAFAFYPKLTILVTNFREPAKLK